MLTNEAHLQAGTSGASPERDTSYLDESMHISEILAKTSPERNVIIDSIRKVAYGPPTVKDSGKKVCRPTKL